jgi:hypothetical protein
MNYAVGLQFLNMATYKVVKYVSASNNLTASGSCAEVNACHASAAGYPGQAREAMSNHYR